MKKSILSFVSIMALGGLALNGCNGNSNSSEPGSCIPDFSAMTVIGYPYQPDDIGYQESSLNGAPVASLAFSLDGTVAYTVTSNYYEKEKLLSINPENGIGTTIADSEQRVTDLSTQPGTGKLLGIQSGTLYDINLADGSATDLGEIENVEWGSKGSLSFATDGTLYHTDDGNLATIDPTDGTELTRIAISEGKYIGLGYNAADGKLYAASQLNFGDVYTIDPSTGVATLVGSVDCPNGDGNCALHDIDFHPTTGEMYGVMGGSDGSEDPDNLVGALVKWSCK